MTAELSHLTCPEHHPVTAGPLNELIKGELARVGMRSHCRPNS